MLIYRPICSQCRGIRDDQGYWQQLEDYLDKHSDIQVSHGVCEDCVKEHYPEFSDSVLKKNNE